jgi:hypothetical protein
VQDFLQAARSALALVASLDPEFIGIVGRVDLVRNSLWWQCRL